MSCEAQEEAKLPRIPAIDPLCQAQWMWELADTGQHRQWDDFSDKLRQNECYHKVGFKLSQDGAWILINPTQAVRARGDGDSTGPREAGYTLMSFPHRSHPRGRGTAAAKTKQNKNPI